MKPRVLIQTDVSGWAWQYKALQVQRWLADEFEVAVHPVFENGDPPRGFDLYHTFDFPSIDRVPQGELAVTGITAHVIPTWGDQAVAKWAARAAALHANSRLLLAEIKRFHPHCYYTPNGVDEALFQRTRARRSGALVVGHVGKPNPRKGAALIREACAAAGVELKVNQARFNGGALPPEGMVDWYQDVHVIAVASDFDGTPNPALEAAACECAVVSNPIGNMPEFVQDGVNGFLVQRSVASLTVALAALRDNMDATILMGQRARQTVLDGWTWRRQAEGYRRMWWEVLRREQGSRFAGGTA